MTGHASVSTWRSRTFTKAVASVDIFRPDKTALARAAASAIVCTSSVNCLSRLMTAAAVNTASLEPEELRLYQSCISLLQGLQPFAIFSGINTVGRVALRREVFTALAVSQLYEHVLRGFAFVVGPSTDCTEQSRQVVLDVAGEVCSARHQPELRPLLAQHGHGLPGPSLQFMLTAMVVELLHFWDGGPRYGLSPEAEAVLRRGMFSPAAVYEVCMRMNTCCMEAAAGQQPCGGDSGGAGASGGGEDARGDAQPEAPSQSVGGVPVSWGDVPMMAWVVDRSGCGASVQDAVRGGCEAALDWTLSRGGGGGLSVDKLVDGYAYAAIFGDVASLRWLTRRLPLPCGWSSRHRILTSFQRGMRLPALLWLAEVAGTPLDGREVADTVLRSSTCADVRAPKAPYWAHVADDVRAWRAATGSKLVGGEEMAAALVEGIP
ncbi:hypothetical protein PLESTB_001236400 [Pleodorina starrii]|uniref:Uncharacterized protein n=1 Tax=Pleodorina starrii TaxID=330485 RepID=A0A9W6BS91_9CHLO|nr:hypothetical protein PLESTB_001236400 [Pleodorina starrii]